ncbi:MAG: NADP-specific glutamate dehydrogenase [Pseudomonadota bacterium]
MTDSDCAMDLESFLDRVQARSPNQDAFHQAVREVAGDLLPLCRDEPRLREALVLDRLTEPDRVVHFRVVWEDDRGRVRLNRGYRVQFNGAIGPYKGGLRFHPSVDLSTLKFLAFEQTFKNALTGLPMGGAKGGADFDPRSCSEREIERFCHAFMVELHRHIGPDTDVPAGDMNVGEREIGFLFGAYRRITNDFEGALTGKGQSFGGSARRTHATGNGLVFFVCRMLGEHGMELDGRTVAISGAGNVATHAADKALSLGARVVTLSDSRGTLVHEDGLSSEQIAAVRRHKTEGRGSLEDCARAFGAEWRADHKPWSVSAEVALPCATENELERDDALALVANGCRAVGEGANMPTTPEARIALHEAGVLFAPAKAANAGGVAVSGLEISQNRAAKPLDAGTVQDELERIMGEIHDRSAAAGRDDDGRIDYARGANVAAFQRLADAMLAQGRF